MNLKELRRRISEGETSDYEFFWSGPFSQWHTSKFKLDGVRYVNAEQYMMAEKARAFRDTNTLSKILREAHPAEIKRLGREVRGYDDSKWAALRYAAVVRGNILKFSQNEGLKKALLATGSKILVEASPKDRIWGIGMDEGHPNVRDPNKWLGENLLGFALTEVRERLR